MKVVFYDTKPYDRESFLSAKDCDQLSWCFYDFRLSEKTAATAKGAEVVCVFVNDQLDSACLEALAKSGVKLITLRCAGYNNVDLAVAKKLGLLVTRVPAYSPYAVAEHTIGLLLALCRKIYRSYNRVREFNFSLTGLVGIDIHNKMIGIVGTGKIGKIVAEILCAFGAEVISYDPYPDMAWAKAYRVRYTTLEELCELADIVSLHTPLLPETLHLLNAETLFKLKQGVIIVNTSRGKVIDTEALIVALKSGHIGGVALDTYEEEEGLFFEDLSGEILLDDELSRLLTFPNVLITAHQAFLTQDALRAIARTTIDNIINLKKGELFLPKTVLT